MFHCLHVSDTGMDNKPITIIITLQIQIYNSKFLQRFRFNRITTWRSNWQGFWKRSILFSFTKDIFDSNFEVSSSHYHNGVQSSWQEKYIGYYEMKVYWRKHICLYLSEVLQDIVANLWAKLLNTQWWESTAFAVLF